MIIEVKKLIGYPVAAIDTGSKVGTISRIIVEQSNGSLLGFMVKSGGFFSQTFALAASDISEWDPNGLVTETSDNLVPPSEIIRLNEIVKSNFELLGLPAKTESGKKLGHVDNYLIDSETASVVKYYLKDIISGDRVFPADKVTNIDNETIVFNDDVLEIPTGAAGAEA